MRIVTGVTSEVQVSAGGSYDLGYHVVWCTKYRRRVLADRGAARCQGLIRTKIDEDGWRIAALEIMPGHVHLFVKAHLCGSPSWVAGRFKGLTSRWLRAGFPQLRSRRPALWSRSYCAAAAGAVPPQAVCQSTGTQDERRWREEQPR